MKEADKIVRLKERISKDIGTLETIVPEGEPLLREMFHLLLDGKKAEARELLSLINRITDNLARLESLLLEGDNADVVILAMTGPARAQVLEAAALFAKVEPLER